MAEIKIQRAPFTKLLLLLGLLLGIDLLVGAWFFVNKIDEHEAFAQWRSQSLLLILAFSGIAALLLALGLAILQRNRKKHYRQLFSAEQLLRQNAERHGVILRGIADAIIVSLPILSVASNSSIRSPRS